MRTELHPHANSRSIRILVTATIAWTCLHCTTQLTQAAETGSRDQSATSPSTQSAGAAHPNVIILLADQWRSQATGYAGDPNAKTPNLDRLANTGVWLTTAASTVPVCSPFKASLITGRYATTHGVFLNDVPLNRDAVSMADAFNQAGYQTGFIGKWHIAGDGRSTFIPKEMRQGFQFWRANECTHSYNHSIYFADTPEPLYWKGYDAEAESREAQSFIKNHQKEPFLLILSWGAPHNPYNIAPEQFRKLFSPDKLQLRPNIPPALEQRTRRDLAGYYAHCAALDTYAGDIAKTLEECHLDRNTIIVFTSDHGDMLGSQGQHFKQRPWDESCLVPFMVHWPAGLGEKGRKLTAPFASPEIMPTLLSLCGIPIPKTVEGEDRADWLKGKAPDADRDALIACISPFGEYTREQSGKEYRGIRTIRYTYVRSLEGPWLLYDNQEDPYQQHNRINDAQLSTTQAELNARLNAELKRRHDDFLPGKAYIAKWGYKTSPSGTVPYHE